MGHLTFFSLIKWSSFWVVPSVIKLDTFCIFSTFVASTQHSSESRLPHRMAMRIGRSVSRLLFLSKQGLYTFPLWTVLKLMLASTSWIRKLAPWSLFLLIPILMTLGVCPQGNRSNGPRTRCSIYSHSPFSLDFVPVTLLPHQGCLFPF